MALPAGLHFERCHDAEGKWVTVKVIDDATEEEVTGLTASVGKVTEHPDMPYLGWLTIDPSMRRRGIGSALVDELVAQYPTGTQFAYAPASEGGERLITQASIRNPTYTFIRL